MATTNQVYAYVFNLAQQIPGINLYIQGVIPWLNLNSYPALFQVQLTDDQINMGVGTPNRYKKSLHYVIAIKQQITNLTTNPPYLVLNDFVDTFKDLFDNQTSQSPVVAQQMLDLNIEQILIEGSISFYQDVLGDDNISYVTIPVSVYGYEQ